MRFTGRRISSNIILSHSKSSFRNVFSDSPYLASGTISSNVQMIDLPLSATIANSSFVAVVGMSSTGSLTLAQPYALVISAQLTPLTGPSHSFTYQTPVDDNVRCYTIIIPTISICLLICPPLAHYRS